MVIFLLDCFKLLDYQNGICILTHPHFALSEFSLILVLQKKTRESDDRHGEDTN